MKLRTPTKARPMSKLLVFECPICGPDSKITRGSQEHLNLAISDHIMRVHEERAALQAVDRARISCPNTSCDIGRRTHCNLSIGTSIMLLTEFDKNLLQGMKVSPD
jgi:hypothetical protein